MISAENRDVLRGRDELRTIFERHFGDFCERYDQDREISIGLEPDRLEPRGVPEPPDPRSPELRNALDEHLSLSELQGLGSDNLMGA